MISFLFWDLMGRQEANRKVRLEQIRIHLARLVAGLDVDVLLFAESAFEPADFTSTLNHLGAGTYHFPSSIGRRLQLYSRLSPGSIVDQFNDPSDGRLTIWRVMTPMNCEVLLAATHFQSQLQWRPDEQALQTTVMCRVIAEVEDVVKHQRTLLVGDLNMNPYDLGMVGAPGLNAVMTKDVARNEVRIVAGRPYRFFYNPMWGLFGDRTPGPPGTYFYSGSGPGNPYWNIFDQVLLRPDIMDSLVELKIIDTDGQESLLTDRGRPRIATASDHLPILFRFNL